MAVSITELSPGRTLGNEPQILILLCRGVQGTAEAGMTASPRVIFLAFKKYSTETDMDAHSTTCFCALMLCSQRIAESLIGYLRISFLTFWYQVPELKKRVVLLFGSKTGCLRGTSSACILQTSARNVTFPYQDTHQVSKLDKKCSHVFVMEVYNFHNQDIFTIKIYDISKSVTSQRGGWQAPI